MNRFTVRLIDWTPMRLTHALSALTIVLLATAAHADQGSSFAGNYLASRTAGHIRDSQAATDFLNAALKIRKIRFSLNACSKTNWPLAILTKLKAPRRK
jgi:hypothetical protein